jgi:hypothetical protein
MIKAGNAPIPSSSNKGMLWVKHFPEPGISTRPISGANMAAVIKALQEKTAAEKLTRAQQKDFVRKNFPTWRITARQFSDIFQAIPVLTGRPAKSDKKL